MCHHLPRMPDMKYVGKERGNAKPHKILSMHSAAVGPRDITAHTHARHWNRGHSGDFFFPCSRPYVINFVLPWEKLFSNYSAITKWPNEVNGKIQQKKERENGVCGIREIRENRKGEWKRKHISGKRHMVYKELGDRNRADRRIGES